MILAATLIVISATPVTARERVNGTRSTALYDVEAANSALAYEVRDRQSRSWYDRHQADALNSNAY